MNAARRTTILAAVAALLPAVAPARVAVQGATAPLPHGVTADMHRAVEGGLRYLVRQQSPSGAFANTGGSGDYPAAMAGMAGMALVASGSTPMRGTYWREVRAAMQFLIDLADRDTGLIADQSIEAKPMYGHGFATLFLASVYGMEEDVVRQERLHAVLLRAVQLIERSQSDAGGWLYTPDAIGDEGSVTVTQVQALRACRMAGIAVDKRTIDRAVDYIRKCQNPDGGVGYSLAARGASRPAITAAAVAVLYDAGYYDDQEFVDAAMRFASQHLLPTVDTTGHHYYAQLYYSQALYQRGGRDWDDYFAKIGAWLVREQRPDGSWQGDGVGPIYGTAVAVWILQLPSALVPIHQR
jgi:Prenyltransferase and squalene oxidase repeat